MQTKINKSHYLYLFIKIKKRTKRKIFPKKNSFKKKVLKNRYKSVFKKNHDREKRSQKK